MADSSALNPQRTDIDCAKFIVHLWFYFKLYNQIIYLKKVFKYVKTRLHNMLLCILGETDIYAVT